MFLTIPSRLTHSWVIVGRNAAKRWVRGFAAAQPASRNRQRMAATATWAIPPGWDVNGIHVDGRIHTGRTLASTNHDCAAPPRVLGPGARRPLGIPRAALLSRLARRQSALQTNGTRRCMGRLAAPYGDTHLQHLLRAPRPNALRWCSLPCLRLCRDGSLAILCERAHRVVEQPRRQPERDKEGVLPTSHDTPGLRHCRPGRFLLRIYGAHRNDVSLRNRARPLDLSIPGISLARDRYRASSRPLAVGAECSVPRRQTYDPIPDAILDVHDAGGLSREHHSAKVAPVVRTQPY